MKRFSSQFAIGVALCVAALPARVMAQRSDSYTWMLGLEAGAMAFQTRVQDTKVVPSAGAHFLIMEHRGGLLVGVDEGIGSDENATSVIQFNDVRRYQAVLMAFPFNGNVEPYFGAGGGIMQVVGPRVNQQLQLDPVTAEEYLSDAEERSSSGFATFLAGVQAGVARIHIFAQYQATTSPSDDKLLQGATQTIMAGIRIGLGSAREGVAAGGY